MSGSRDLFYKYRRGSAARAILSEVPTGIWLLRSDIYALIRKARKKINKVRFNKAFNQVVQDGCFFSKQDPSTPRVRYLYLKINVSCRENPIDTTHSSGDTARP